MESRPAGFTLKKWLIMGICALYIVVLIVFAILSSKLVDDAIDQIGIENDFDAVRVSLVSRIS